MTLHIISEGIFFDDLKKKTNPNQTLCHEKELKHIMWLKYLLAIAIYVFMEHRCLCNDFVLWDFSGILSFLYTDTQLLAKLEGTFVILHITSVLFSPYS